MGTVVKITWEEHCQLVAKGLPGCPVVEVIWEDAVAYALDWEEAASSKLCLTTTVGYLVKETKRSITVASIINSTHIGHGIVIPKAGILSQRKI